jgi:predicted nucleotidyltransferase
MKEVIIQQEALERLRDNHNQRTCATVMHQTSLGLRTELEVIWQDVNAENAGLLTSGYGLLVFGSPNRAEMLPQSDVDVVVITPDQSSPVRTQLIQRVQSLSYDKIDVPFEWYSLSQLKANALIGSPESDYADTTFIVGTSDINTAHSTEGITDIFFDRSTLQVKLLFQHYFFDYRYATKSAGGGTNLKYSQGGARDFIYFDWYYDYMRGRQARHRSTAEAYPQCFDAIEQLSAMGVLPEEVALQTLGAIDYVGMIKYLALEVNKGTESKGKGFMNQELATRMLASYPDYFMQLGLITPDAVVAYFDVARSVVYRTRTELLGRLFKDVAMDSGITLDGSFDKLTQEQVADIYGNSRFGRMAQIWRIHQQKNQEALAVLYQEVKEVPDWMMLASIASSDAVSPFILDDIARRYSHIPGFEYMSRVVIKHPFVQRSTLEYLSSLPRLAIDDGMDLQYREHIRNKLNK